MPNFVCKHCGMITENPEIVPFFSISSRHFFKITCPVCLNETRFWRDELFPADKPDDTPYPVLRLELRAETRFGEILQEEIDKAEEKGCRVKVIELPKFSHFKGIPIRYY